MHQPTPFYDFTFSHSNICLYHFTFYIEVSSQAEIYLHSGVIAVYQPTPFYDFTFSDKYSSICLGWKRQKVHILPNSVSFGSLTYGKTCVLSITGALAGWEHVLIGFQHIQNRELESRNKSKLPFILPGTRNLDICTLSSSEQVQGTNPNCLLFFPTEG